MDTYASPDAAEMPSASTPAATEIAVPPVEVLPDPMMVKVGRLLKTQIDDNGWRFTIQGRELPSEQLASPEGLLAVFAFEASSIFEEMMGRPLPLSFFPNPKALLEVSPSSDESSDNTLTMWSHCMHYAVESLVRPSIRNTLQASPVETLMILNPKPRQHGDAAATPLPEMVSLDVVYDRWYEAAKNEQLKFIEPPVRPSTSVR